MLESAGCGARGGGKGVAIAVAVALLVAARGIADGARRTGQYPTGRLDGGRIDLGPIDLGRIDVGRIDAGRVDTLSAGGASCVASGARRAAMDGSTTACGIASGGVFPSFPSREGAADSPWVFSRKASS